jgi:FlaA1/EpsC-like NDP-sugar epimerase
MRTLISLGVAFFVMVLHLLIGGELTPDLSAETAGNILVMAFIGTAVITSLVLKYRRGRTAMIRRILISLGVGLVDLAFLYVTLFVPNPRFFVMDAATEIVVSASLVSVVTFVLLSLPPRLSNEWQKALISLSVAFLVAVIIGTSIVSFVEEISYEKGMRIFSGVFIGAALVTSLVLRRWGRHR